MADPKIEEVMKMLASKLPKQGGVVILHTSGDGATVTSASPNVKIVKD